MSEQKQKQIFVKQQAFRFCQVTTRNLEELVDLGIVRNKTEAIDLAIMRFLAEEKARMGPPRGKAPGGNWGNEGIISARGEGVSQSSY